MGIDIAGFHFMMENRSYIKGDFLMLGRQGMHLWGDNLSRGNELFYQYDNAGRYESIFMNGGHSDNFFSYLGAASVNSMDYSDFEGASIIHDLNIPVPKELRNKFDVVFDGGTTEHVFDVRMVVTNIKNLLKVGGYFIAFTPANNLCGHGFYQFSPEFYRTVFSEENGFKIHKFQMMVVSDDGQSYNIVDLAAPPKGQRQDLKTGPFGVLNAVIIEKIEHKVTEDYQQSDYLREWGKL